MNDKYYVNDFAYFLPNIWISKTEDDVYIIIKTDDTAEHKGVYIKTIYDFTEQDCIKTTMNFVYDYFDLAKLVLVNFHTEECINRGVEKYIGEKMYELLIKHFGVPYTIIDNESEKKNRYTINKTVNFLCKNIYKFYYEYAFSMCNDIHYTDDDVALYESIPNIEDKCIFQ